MADKPKDEDIWNAHVLTIQEAKRRGLKLEELQDGLDEPLQVSKKVPQEGLERARKLWKELPERIVVCPEHTCLTGSYLYANNGHEPKDVDVVFRQEHPVADSGALKLERAIKEITGKKAQFINEPAGPNFHFLPMFDLVLEKRPDFRVEEIDDGSAETYAAPVNKAELTTDEKRIRPGKPHAVYEVGAEFQSGEEGDLVEWAQKAWAKGAAVYGQIKADGQRMSVHKQGEEVWIFTESGRDRSDALKPLADLVRTLPFKEIVLDVEAVQVENGKPVPRVDTLWLIHAKEWEPGATVELQVHDLLWLNGENLAVQPYSERIEALLDNRSRLTRGLEGNRIEVMQTRVARDREQMLKMVEWASDQPGSEGLMAKWGHFPYKLAGANQGVAKLKQLLEIDAEVIGWRKIPAPRPAGVKWTSAEAMSKLPELLKVSKTYIFRVALKHNGKLVPVERDAKLAPGELKLEWDEARQKWMGTEDQKLWIMAPGWRDRQASEIPYGSTYAVALEETPKPGLIITIAPAAVQVFARDQSPLPKDFKPSDFDPRKHGLSWEFPKVRNLKPDQKEPGTIEAVLERAGEKVIPRKRIVKELPCQPVRKQQGIEHYLAYPDDPNKRFPAVFQLHARGKSVHGDIRISKGDSLVGWTVAMQTEGAIKEPVEKLEDLRRVSRNASAWKLDPTTGKWADRQIADGTVRRTSLQTFLKSSQPTAWLKIEGVVKPKEVGATAEYPGVFLIADKFEAEHGAYKTDVHEVFAYGKILNGRYLFRPLVLGKSMSQSFDEELRDFSIFKQFVLPPSEEQGIPGAATWLFLMPDDQLPNVLAQSSTEERPWIPPKGVSALPAKVREMVPPELRYWLASSEKKRMEVRKELVDRWKADGTLKWIADGGWAEDRALEIRGLKRPPKPVAKHVLVGGKWSPTAGEAGLTPDGMKALASAVRGTFKDAARIMTENPKAERVAARMGVEKLENVHGKVLELSVRARNAGDDDVGDQLRTASLAIGKIKSHLEEGRWKDAEERVKFVGTLLNEAEDLLRASRAHGKRLKGLPKEKR